MKVGVPKETAVGERRIALVPEIVTKLVASGVDVVVERGAGEGASFADDAFKDAGATLGDPWEAEVVAKVRRPGAVVSGFGVRPVVKEQVESLGATFLDLGVVGEETEGGYARELSEDEQRRQQEELEARIGDFDVVVTTALIPGRPAPKLIPRSAIESMRPGSVIVDLAAEAGGNAELTKADEEVSHNGVTILGPTNLPSTMPYHASQLYARNVSALIQHLAPEGELQLDFEDEITAGACVTREKVQA